MKERKWQRGGRFEKGWLPPLWVRLAWSASFDIVVKVLVKETAKSESYNERVKVSVKKDLKRKKMLGLTWSASAATVVKALVKVRVTMKE